MLILSLRQGERVYLGSACVVELIRHAALTAVLRVWDRGAESRCFVSFRNAATLAGTWQVSLSSPTHGGQVRVRFIAPRAVRIVRGELLPWRERHVMDAAAGAPLSEPQEQGERS